MGVDPSCKANQPRCVLSAVNQNEETRSSQAAAYGERRSISRHIRKANFLKRNRRSMTEPGIEVTRAMPTSEGGGYVC